MKHIARWLLIAALALIPVLFADAQTIPGGGGGCAGSFCSASAPLATSLGGLGGNYSASTGIPYFATGTTTMATTTGTGSVVLSSSPSIANPTLTGTVTTPITGSIQCLQASSSGILSGTGSSCGAGSGSVTSVALASASNVACIVSGSPVTTTGTLTCTPAGTSGGVPYFSSASALSSSAALTANLPVIGGGAGAAPAVGTRSGNTTAYVTTTGSQTSGDVVSVDANGNHIASGTALTNLVTTNTAQTITASKRGTVQTVSPSSNTYTPNFDTGNNFTITLAATNTIANPSTTPVAGQSGIIEIIQDGTGSRTVTWGSQYVAAGGVATLVLSTPASAKDYASYYVVDSTHILVSLGALNASH